MSTQQLGLETPLQKQLVPVKHVVKLCFMVVWQIVSERPPLVQTNSCVVCWTNIFFSGEKPLKKKSFCEFAWIKLYEENLAELRNSTVQFKGKWYFAALWQRNMIKEVLVSHLSTIFVFSLLIMQCANECPKFFLNIQRNIFCMHFHKSIRPTPEFLYVCISSQITSVIISFSSSPLSPRHFVNTEQIYVCLLCCLSTKHEMIHSVIGSLLLGPCVTFVKHLELLESGWMLNVSPFPKKSLCGFKSCLYPFNKYLRLKRLLT